VDDEVAEAVVRADGERFGMKIGFDVGGRHAGAIVFYGELQMSVDDGEGNADLAGWGEGNGRRAGLAAPDGFGGVAHQVDGDALDDFGGKVEGREGGWAGDDDGGGAGGDAFENRCEREQRDGVAWGGGEGVGGALRTAVEQHGREEAFCVAGQSEIEGGGCGGHEQATDECGAAIGDEV